MFARDGNLTAVPFDLATGRVTGEPSAVGGSVAVGIAAPYSSATPDHSRILIRVSPEAAKDNGEIRLLFGWQDALRRAGSDLRHPSESDRSRRAGLEPCRARAG